MRKHNYVVGYEGDGQCVYGKPEEDGSSNYITPLTLIQAKMLAKKIVDKRCKIIDKSVVYKLVRVK